MALLQGSRFRSIPKPLKYFIQHTFLHSLWDDRALNIAPRAAFAPRVEPAGGEEDALAALEFVEVLSGYAG